MWILMSFAAKKEFNLFYVIGEQEGLGSLRPLILPDRTLGAIDHPQSP